MCFYMVVKYGYFYPAEAIDQVYKDFCKNIFKVKRSTVNEIILIYGELGRVQLIVPQRYMRIMKYWQFFFK